MALGLNNIFTGARAIVRLGGEEIGYATRVRFSESIMYEAIRTIGRMTVTEFAPQAYDCSATAERFYLVKNPLSSVQTTSPNGSWRDLVINSNGTTSTAWPKQGSSATPANGTVDEEFLGNVYKTLIADISLEIYDYQMEPVFRMEQCVIAARDLGVEQGVSTLENVVILGVRFFDETQV